jgi:hypothetical protein
LFVRVYGDYERHKARANRIDFDDLLLETVSSCETDPDAAETIRARKRWFSVDEYQDTNPLAAATPRSCGSAIATTCASSATRTRRSTRSPARPSDYLDRFVERHPGAREITLSRNYRSTPQILALANRLLAAEGRRKQLIATLPRARPRDRAASRRGGGAGAPGGVDPGPRRRRHTRVGDAILRSDQRPDPADRGRADEGQGSRSACAASEFFERSEVRDAMRIAKRLPGRRSRIPAACRVRCPPAG